MEPKFQTSFIPKKPIVSNQISASPVVRSTNIFSLVANVVFVVILLFSGALFFYKNIINSQIVADGQQLDSARSAFQLDKIQQLIDTNSRMVATKDLLDKHIAVSKLLLYFEQVTVKKVRLDQFAYSVTDNVPNINMKVEAQSYNALATEGDIYSKSDFIKSPKFFDFAPEDNGYVVASFSSSIDPGLVSYKKAIDSLSINQ